MRYNFSTLSGVAAAWESHFCSSAWAEHLGHDVGDLARLERSGLAPRTVDHIEGLERALEIVLDDDTLAAFDKLFPLQAEPGQARPEAYTR